MPRTVGRPPKQVSARRLQINWTATAAAAQALDVLCARKVQEYAARGIDRDPRRVQSEVLCELVFREAQV